MTCPLSSSTEKVALGKTCLMLPITSSGASLRFCGVVALGTRTRFLLFLLRTAMVSSPFAGVGLTVVPQAGPQQRTNRAHPKMNPAEGCCSTGKRRSLKSDRSFSGAILSTARKIALRCDKGDSLTNPGRPQAIPGSEAARVPAAYGRRSIFEIAFLGTS